MAETILVAIIVAAAAGYLLVAGVRFFRGTGGCGGGCQCHGPDGRGSDRLGARRELLNLGVDRRDP
jgi:hypothetical protein